MSGRGVALPQRAGPRPRRFGSEALLVMTDFTARDVLHEIGIGQGFLGQ